MLQLLGGAFFYYSHLELYNTFWNAIVVMPECRAGSLPLLIDCGGDGFTKTVSAGVPFPYCSLQRTLLLFAGCWGVSSFISLPFQAVPWNSVFQLIFLQQWFFCFWKGNLKLPELNSWTLWYLWYYSPCLYSHGQLVLIISTGITGSFIMNYLIFLTQKGKINLQN